MRLLQDWRFLVPGYLLGLTFVLHGSVVVGADHQSQQQSGITWAMQAMAALTGGKPVTSVSESGTVTRTDGGDQEQGTITLQSTGNTSSQIMLSTNAGNRSESRYWDTDGPGGQWIDLSGQPHNMAQHNCWTDAVWFFPALSMLSDYSDPTLVFIDLGPQQYNGGTVEHIQAYRTYPGLPDQQAEELERLSTVDYYLDPQTALPLGLAFFTHDDKNIASSVPVFILFSQYQTVSGIQVPFQVTRALDGAPLFQITITNALPNGQQLPIRKH